MAGADLEDLAKYEAKPATTDDLAKYETRTDSSKGFFAQGNESAKDPFAFSKEYAASHPAQPQSTWQKIKSYAGAATRPWEGAMAPRNAEEALSGFEMLGGEIGGALLGPAGKSAASSGVKSAITAAEPKQIPAVETAKVPSIVRKPGEILPERVGTPSTARIPAIAQRSGESILPGGGVIKRPPLALLPESTAKPQIPMANAEPFQLTLPPAVSEPPVQLGLNLQAPPKASIKTLGDLIEKQAGTPSLQSNVPLREQIPPRTAVIPRAPLGSRVAVPVGEQFGPMTKRMGEIPRAVTEEPMRQMGAPPMRPGVSLREQPKTAEAPIRSEQARLEEKYSDKAIRQMVHANGEEMVDAIGNDADTMKAVHNLTNPDVRQAMINSGEDMGQMGINNRKLEGGGSMSRQAAFKKLLSKGLTPQQIVELARKPIEAR